MRVDAPQLAVDPAVGQGAVDGVRLVDRRLGRALLGEAQPGARRVIRLGGQPRLKGRDVGEGQERKFDRHPSAQYSCAVGRNRISLIPTSSGWLMAKTTQRPNESAGMAIL